MNRMQFQYDYMGGSSPQNLGILVCPTCLDDLAFQQKLLILPPDPQPFFNTRPENYVVDETNWLVTQDDEIITTESGEDFVTPIPNPSDDADTVRLVCSISSPGSTITVLYFDAFDGDPSNGGQSVLSVLTGSSVRTDIASSMTTVTGLAQNADVIEITAASTAATNISWVGLYSASSGGTLLMGGAVSAAPTISDGATVQFDPLALRISLV